MTHKLQQISCIYGMYMHCDYRHDCGNDSAVSLSEFVSKFHVAKQGVACEVYTKCHLHAMIPWHQ